MGWEYCQQLAAKGCNILMVSIQKEQLESMPKELEEKYGVKAWGLYMDLSKDTAAREVWDYCQEQREAIASWQGIRRILLAEMDIVIAQKHTGELVFAGSGQDLYGTFGRDSFRKLQDRELVGACSYCGGESYYYVFLDADGALHSRHRSAEGLFLQVDGLDHLCLALREDGRVALLHGYFEEPWKDWPPMRQITIGRRDFNNYDILFVAGLTATET